MRSLKTLISSGFVVAALVFLTINDPVPASASQPPILSTRTTTPIQTGFGGNEDFCAQRPLSGEIDYNGTTGDVSMRLAVGGLPKSQVVVINWANNTVRGYEIGYFLTHQAGIPKSTSLRLSRAGEERGYKIVLTTAANAPRTLGVLWPCDSPPRVPALTVDDPRVTVTPDTGLKDGQIVKVTVTGFGEYGKVWISECDHAEDANYLGCGPQLAAQPFVITNEHRAGSSNFNVRSPAPSRPLDTTSYLTTCSNLCVIVAENGNAWAVAPMAFGPFPLVNPR